MSLMDKEKTALMIARDFSPLRNLFAKEIIVNGYSLSVCPDLEQGWRHFLDEYPDLVCLDLEDCGAAQTCDFCRKIRKEPRGRYVTILAVEPPGRVGDMAETFESGANFSFTFSRNPASPEGWFIPVNRSVDDLTDLRESHDKLKAYRDEVTFMNTQLEEALTKANQLAVDAEVAYLELDQIFKSAAGGILVIDTQLKVLRFNEAFLKTVKMEKAEVKGRECCDIFPSSLCHTSQCPLEEIKKGKRRVQCEVEKVDKDGAVVFYMITSTPLRGLDADLLAMVTNIVDITARVEAEKALRENEERFRLVSEKAPFGQSILRHDQTFEYLNPEFTKVFGYTLEDIPTEQAWLENAYPDEVYRAGVVETMTNHKGPRNGSEDEGERVFTVTCKNGHEKIIDLEVVDIGNQRKVITYVDVTDRKRAEEALKMSEKRYKELSTVDDLTGLYNKRHMKDLLNSEMDRALRYQRSLSLMLMDIDNFKHYNDTYGHTQGDQVLAKIGQIISNSIRKSDAACRYGGEEFVVIMPDTHCKAAVKVAERIREKFASVDFFPSPDEKIRKTVSIGVTELLQDEDGKNLIERADQNMYQAKEGGKNRVVYS